MLTLGVDSSAKTASVAILDTEQNPPAVLAFSYTNNKLTHSTTLMPLIADALKNSSIDINRIELLCVTHGPGSFTGIRIGVAAVKGLGDGLGIPCAGVSTLKAMAYGVACCGDNIICAVMDARANQVYNAVFEIKNGIITRLCEDRAIALDELLGELKKLDKPVVFVGDGADLCYNNMIDSIDCMVFTNDILKYQTAIGCVLAAHDEKKIKSRDLVPTYLRVSQAERMKGQ